MNTAIARPLLQKLLIESMVCFCDGWRVHDPATNSAVDLLLLQLAIYENARAGMSHSVLVSKVKPLTGEDWNNRCKEMSSDFLTDLIIFAQDHQKEWAYLYGAALTSDALKLSKIKMFNINTNPS